jgi:hypothetical protein
MLRLAGGQVESLFDQLLPIEVRELPADLAALDRLLADPRLLAGWRPRRRLSLTRPDAGAAPALPCWAGCSTPTSQMSPGAAM